MKLGMLRVARVVSAVAAGRILNPKTARSQIMGAVVGGIGMALLEESVIDHRYGRFMNHNFAEYHVPVNADVHDIEVFVDKREPQLNPLGVKGIGEIGIVGTAAAIANAVFHATGVRVRDLPITIDKLLGQEFVSSGAEAVVVTGCDHLLIEKALDGLVLRFAHNSSWTRGMGSSIAAGVMALGSQVRGAFVVPGDMPFLTSALLKTLMTTLYRESGRVDRLSNRTSGRAAQPRLVASTVLPPPRVAQRVGRGQGLVRGLHRFSKAAASG